MYKPYVSKKKKRACALSLAEEYVSEHFLGLFAKRYD